jgi:hypothetical protein
MYDSNTYQATSRDENFQNILTNAADTLQCRIREYDLKRDPLQQTRLKLLCDLVNIEAEKVALGRADSYSALDGPIMAAANWGEPDDSDLMKAFNNAKMFFYRNYSIDQAS